MQHLQSNTTLQSGKYRIERVLGQGGFGITYLATQVSSNRQVAIKEFYMFPGSIRENNCKRVLCYQQGLGLECYLEAKEKSKQIAEHLHAIKNEHVIDVSDVFEENDTFYYVMEYVDGESLKERMNRICHPMSEEEVTFIIPQMLDGLQSIHDEGISHLDLQPSNILIDKNQHIKLIDWGFKISLDQMLEDKGVIIDTVFTTIPSYFPPELLGRQYQRIGPWTDSYLLGATLYNLLTNERPPHFGEIIDDKRKNKYNSLPMPSNITPQMRELILWLMKVRIEDRPQSMHEIRDFMATPMSSSLQITDCNQKDDMLESSSDLEDNQKKHFWETLLEELF